MDYRLILVEGLPGTGKTTWAGRIFDHLTRKGIKAELLLEESSRLPSNFCDIAGIPKADLPGALQGIPVITETDHYVFVNLGGCEGETADRLRRFDVGDEFNECITAAEYARCTLEWWRNWALNNKTESVMILDSAFMQCPINEMIFRKASDSQVSVYIQAIAEIISPLSPVCVYLRRQSAKTSIDFAKAAKGEHWAGQTHE